MWVEPSSMELSEDLEQCLVRWPDGSVSREHVGKVNGQPALYCSHRGHLFHTAMGEGFELNDGQPEPAQKPSEAPQVPAEEAQPDKPQPSSSPNAAAAPKPFEEPLDPPAAEDDGKPRRVKVSK